MATKNLQPAVIKYRELRRTVGLLGMFFPVIIALGGKVLFSMSLKPSLSQYYYSDMRDVFVGLLFAIGVFLTAYRGYELQDRYIGLATGLCAMGVALFPMPLSSCPRPNASYAHYVFAVLFFVLLIYFCFHEFTQTKGEFTDRKKIRNWIYKTCGGIMTVCLGGMIAEFIIYLVGLEPEWLANANLIFWGEAVSIFFFGVSWLVKGDTLFMDK
ncbi:MAG TPA: DUF998 domain-containing protein [Gammaproteobacteria bacterium]|nr:DUF998 domain-containing protein [Gammaproteobacteria bacterium]